jgi:hypothetical protein
MKLFWTESFASLRSTSATSCFPAKNSRPTIRRSWLELGTMTGQEGWLAPAAFIVAYRAGASLPS